MEGPSKSSKKESEIEQIITILTEESDNTISEMKESLRVLEYVTKKLDEYFHEKNGV